MKNFIQPGHNVTLPAPAAVVSGQGVQIGDLFGVAIASAESGADVVLSIEGVHELPKTVTNAVAVGASLYWDGSQLTVTDTGNLFVGHAVAPAGNPSATVKVRLSV